VAASAGGGAFTGKSAAAASRKCEKHRRHSTPFSSQSSSLNGHFTANFRDRPTTKTGARTVVIHRVREGTLRPLALFVSEEIAKAAISGNRPPHDALINLGKTSWRCCLVNLPPLIGRQLRQKFQNAVKRR